MTNKEFQYIKDVILKIEININWGPSSDWKQRDFESLCELIFEKTNIQLSLSTLKRLWKLEFKHLPQTETLNCIVQLIGYKNWQEYKTNQHLKEKKNARYKLKPQLFYVVVSIMVAAIVLMSLNKKNENSGANIDRSLIAGLNVKFSAKSISNNIPNTVIFRYNIPELIEDSIIIQQSWDKRRREKVSLLDSIYTSQYYYPGFFNAKLIYKDSLIKEYPIHITTDGWQGLSTETGRDEIPTYIPDQFIKSNGNLYVSPKTLKEYNVDLKTVSKWIHFFNSKSFEPLSCSNFIFETRIKNALVDGSLSCQQAYVSLHFEKGRARIPLSIPGCVSDLLLIYNDYFLTGKKNDLSAFGTNMNDWQKLKITAKGKQVNIFLNDELIKSFKYSTNSGKLKYLQYRFKGCGKVDYVKLSDTTGYQILYDEFL